MLSKPPIDCGFIGQALDQVIISLDCKMERSQATAPLTNCQQNSQNSSIHRHYSNIQFPAIIKDRLQILAELLL